MSKTFTYEAAGVKSTVELREDGFFHELETQKWGPNIYVPREKTAGARYVNIYTWIGDMNHASHVRYPWKRHHHEKLKADESSVVWVASAGHYMEIRRGSQTKFAEGERRTWPTAAAWFASLTTPAPAIVVKEMVVSPAPVPAVVPAKPFDAEKFKGDINSLLGWAKEKTTTNGKRAAAIIQICHWLLEMKTRPEVAAWLEETPLWHVSIRASVQGMQLEWSTDGSASTVAEFLKAF